MWTNNNNNEIFLRPPSIYIENTLQKICVVACIEHNNGLIPVWSQPIHFIQNKYPSSIVNDWDGGFKLDEKNNAILAAKVVAGKKNSDNTFSGVMMGDWENHEKGESAEGALEIGLYGFNKGAASFGFTVDGTAFIGKAGVGRLEFDGNKSTITSNRMALGCGGMELDFDDGKIEMSNPAKYIYILYADKWNDKEYEITIKDLEKTAKPSFGTLTNDDGITITTK